MQNIHKISQLLISSLRLARGDEDSFNTTRGVLDLALKRAIDKNLFPVWMRKELNFAISRTGLRCVELPHILDWAQTAELTKAPNPSYQMTQFDIDKELAEHFLSEMKVSLKKAREWGQELWLFLDEIDAKLDKYEQVQLS